MCRNDGSESLFTHLGTHRPLGQSWCRSRWFSRSQVFNWDRTTTTSGWTRQSEESLEIGCSSGCNAGCSWWITNRGMDFSSFCFSSLRVSTFVSVRFPFKHADFCRLILVSSPRFPNPPLLAFYFVHKFFFHFWFKLKKKMDTVNYETVIFRSNFRAGRKSERKN